MPIVAPKPLAPYDTLGVILNTARNRVLDAMASLGGELFTNNQSNLAAPGAPWITYQSVFAAWRKLQDFLFANGFPRMSDRAILYSLPSCSVADGGIFVWLNWSQYFDGANTFPVGAAPVLPSRLCEPIKIFERPAVGTSGNPQQFLEMDKILVNLPPAPKRAWNGVWRWFNDALYMPGATAMTDLLIEFLSYLPDIPPGPEENGAPTVDGTQIVPILRCHDALADFIAYEWCASRGDMDAPAILQRAQQEALLLLSRRDEESRMIWKTSETEKQSDRYTDSMRQVAGVQQQ